MHFKPEQYDAILHRLVDGGTLGGEPVPGNPNMLIPWFLMSVFAYEELDDPFLTDGCYDWCCRELDARWDAIEHQHKHLIDRDALRTGTASYLKGKLPTTVQNAARALLRDYEHPEEVRPRAKPSIDDLLGLAVTLNDLL